MITVPPSPDLAAALDAKKPVAWILSMRGKERQQLGAALRVAVHTR